VVWHSGECADEIFGGYPWFKMDNLLYGDIFPWAADAGARTRFLKDEVMQALKPEEYIRKRYFETLERVPLLKSETDMEKRRRIMFYMNITWFMSALLERKDRMSMGTGLEVRVPYCDHVLAQYAFNIPYDIKYMNKIEKGLLRKVFESILPKEVYERQKSPYPKTHNPGYTEIVKSMLSDIIASPNEPLNVFIDKGKLTKSIEDPEPDNTPWYGQLMCLPQMYAFLIQVNEWLKHYKVKLF
jgi:asparagine synthase (glutamine-hydrolysing)